MAETPTPRTPEGKEALAALLARPESAVVAFDFDGTLSPIVPDPEKARAHPGAVAALGRLAPHVRAVCVVTGRPAGVAVRYGGFAGVPELEHMVVLGHYGAERWDARTGEVHGAGEHPGVAAVRAELPGVLDRNGAWRGTWTEDKGGRAVAVHTRRAQDPQAAFEALRGPMAELAARHGLVVEPGRYVLELRPPGIDKGVALTAFLREVDAGSILYGGDDLGDLAAYGAVRALRADGMPGVLVAAAGDDSPAEITGQADLVVAGPGGVVDLVNALADALA